MTNAKTNERQYVELKRKRLFLCKLLNGLEIREAAKNIEKQRLLFNEEEILLGATISIKMPSYTEVYLVAERPETDNEYAARLEKLRLEEEAKAERKRKRDAAAAASIQRKKDRERESLKKQIQELAKTLSEDELKALLLSR
jgi:hypothetical protein